MITRDDWLAALREAEADEIPESDALTVQEFADMIGMKRHAALRRMAILVREGRAVRTLKKFRRTDNQITSVSAYRLVKPEP